MKVFCETVFSDLLPALRAIMTRELIETYGLTQLEVSRKLGITQPAVSQYKSGLRGKNIKLLLSNRKFMRWVRKLAEEIIAGKISFGECICEICRESRKDEIFSRKELQPFLCLIKISQRGKR